MVIDASSGGTRVLKLSSGSPEISQQHGLWWSYIGQISDERPRMLGHGGRPAENNQPIQYRRIYIAPRISSPLAKSVCTVSSQPERSNYRPVIDPTG
jgi:hypothetical protein